MSSHQSVTKLLPQRVVALIALTFASVMLLIALGATPAKADNYPPTNPSSTSRTGVEPVIVNRQSSASSSVANESSNRSSGLSSTGFQALTATGIAVVLLGAGALFLGLGRRRRHG